MHVRLPSEFLRYLVRGGFSPGERLPPIPDMAKQLGISTGKLREQLEVGRQLGLVEVRPKTGIRRLEYAFYPAIRTSLLFCLATDPKGFEQFGLLRSHIETSFWHEAVRSLGTRDKQRLKGLVDQAWKKLRSNPAQIPHAEHRDFHLTIYSRLENPFVRGILEGYWEAYEAVGLNVYADYTYLQEVWTYHQRMVDAILSDDYEGGYQALVEHTRLLQHRPQADGLVATESVI